MIQEDLSLLRNFFDLESLSEENFSKDDTSAYYTISRLWYSIFHDKKHLHMWISQNDNIYRISDLHTSLEIISSYVTNDSRNILELGCGRWGNIEYIAKKFPTTIFVWLDYSTTQLSYTKSIQLHNTKFIQWDFHDLPFWDDSQDLVYIIESLCHSNDKRKVLQEIQRVLKKWWICIIIDWYAAKNKLNMSKKELLSMKLTAKWMAVDNFEDYDSFRSTCKDVFQIIKEDNVSKKILPTTDRFKKLSKRFLNTWILAKFLISVLPHYFTMNAVSWTLISGLIREWIASYWITVIKK